MNTFRSKNSCFLKLTRSLRFPENVSMEYFKTKVFGGLNTFAYEFLLKTVKLIYTYFLEVNFFHSINKNSKEARLLSNCSELLGSVGRNTRECILPLPARYVNSARVLKEEFVKGSLEIY